MNMLLEMEVPELFNRIMELKDCYDCGGKRIVEIVSYYGAEVDEYECNAMEDLYSLPELIGQDYLDFNAEPLDDGDYDNTAGERLVFQSKELTEYYKLLMKLRRKRIITKTELDRKKEELDRISYIYVNRGNYYSFDYYVPCDIRYTDSKAMPVRLDIYFDYQCGYSLFSVLCGVIALMAKYSEMLKELQEKYCETEQIKEAA